MAENTYEIKWHLLMNKTGRWKKEKNRLKEHILKIYMQTLIWDQRLNSQQLTLQLLKYMFHLLVKWKTTAMVCIWFGCAPIGSDVILIWACQVSYKKLVKWTQLRGGGTFEKVMDSQEHHLGKITAGLRLGMYVPRRGCLKSRPHRASDLFPFCLFPLHFSPSCDTPTRGSSPEVKQTASKTEQINFLS